jgi:DNA invertase Pin-like site-specific DNA recombinase
MESIYDRPVLERLRNLVSAGKVQMVACYDTDRLARDPNELTIVVRGFHKDGAKPLFVRLDHETTGRVGEMVLYMKGFASAVEWDLIRDRSMRGRQDIYNAGNWVGHGRVRYGLLWDKATRSRPACPERAPVVRRIFEAVAGGVDPADLARMLIMDGVPPPHTAPWNGKTIRDIIRDLVYKGVVYARQTRPNGRRSPKGKALSSRRPPEEWLQLDDHRTEAIVSEDLWNLANAMLAAIPTRTRMDVVPSDRDFLLSCMVWCGKCGRKMTQARIKNRFTPGAKCRAYRCTGDAPNRKERNACNSSLGAIRLENDAWGKVLAFLLDPDALEIHLAHLEAAKREATIGGDLAAAEKRSKAIARQVRDVIEAQAKATSKLVQRTLAEKLQELDAQATLIDGQMEILKSRLDSIGHSQEVIASFRDKVKSLREVARRGELTYDNKRTILVSLGVRVIGWKGDCRVEIEVEDAVLRHYKESSSGIIRAGR